MRMIELDESSGRELQSILSRADVDLSAASRAAQRIIRSVRTGGDKALLALAKKYEGFTGSGLRVPEDVLADSWRGLPDAVKSALTASRDRVTAFHSEQKLEPFEFRDDCATLGTKVVPLDRVGVYAPGGTAAYASSVIMACVPACVAGVPEIALFTPGKGGKASPLVLAAAHLCGVKEAYCVGGAQAIAAMAYGTESIRKVRKIVGPGGPYVAAAKQLVRDDCEIDFLAGPSEILVIADGRASARLIATDMLAQLEHDTLARAVLVSPSRAVLLRTREALEKLIDSAERKEIASEAAGRGAIFVLARDMRSAIWFANEYAPEHLLIDTADSESILRDISNAGSVFLGRHSSVAFGDYCTGTNHILPTKGLAASKSGLSVMDFQKVIPYQSVTPRGATRLSRLVRELATAEGLPAHADAAMARAGRGVR